MIRRSRIASLLALCALAVLGLSGCGSHVGGDWAGTWTGANGTSGSLTMALRQQGSSVSGDVVWTGLGCFSTGTVAGEVDGDKLSLTAQSASVTITLDGTVAEDETTLGGNFAIAGGACAGQTGTWTVQQ